MGICLLLRIYGATLVSGGHNKLYRPINDSFPAFRKKWPSTFSLSSASQTFPTASMSPISNRSYPGGGMTRAFLYISTIRPLSTESKHSKRVCFAWSLLTKVGGKSKLPMLLNEENVLEHGHSPKCEHCEPREDWTSSSLVITFKLV